jgi:hypothetical protein
VFRSLIRLLACAAGSRTAKAKNAVTMSRAQGWPSAGVLLASILVASSAVARAQATGCSADLCVGPNFPLKRPSDAAQVAKNGQSIAIAAAVYANDVAVFRQHDLTIRGIDGLAHLHVDDDVSAEDKAIWVIKGNNTTIENIEFSGAHVRDRNGAGIRLEGANLRLTRCYFHDNENGILTGKNLESDIVIEHSEFFGGGERGGSAHGIYVGEVRSFTLRFSYFHHASIGHLVKSRAHSNYILYNRIMDEADGDSSYAIDLPNGGFGVIMGNLIQQGPRTDNDALIAFGAERAHITNPIQELFLVNNTLVNDARSGRFVMAPFPSEKIILLNNIFSGPGERYTTKTGGAPTDQGNVQVQRSEFVDADAFDYRLKAGSKAIDAGVAPITVRGMPLNPVFQYVHKSQSGPRKVRGPLDAGALEFESH